MASLEGVFLCLGNPLLDISSNVDAAFLDKYEVSGRSGRSGRAPAGRLGLEAEIAANLALPAQLKPANQILAEEKHVPMYAVSWGGHSAGATS